MNSGRPVATRARPAGRGYSGLRKMNRKSKIKNKSRS